MNEYFVVLKNGVSFKVKADGLSDHDTDFKYPFLKGKELNREIIINASELAAIINVTSMPEQAQA